jgi:hypothetical protein
LLPLQERFETQLTAWAKAARAETNEEQVGS